MRRFVVAALAALWLLPVALACGLALHVAFDHAQPTESDGDGKHAAALPALLEHGHAHTGGDRDHQHRVLPAASVTLRGVASPLPPTGQLVTIVNGAGAAFAASLDVVSLAPPPRAAGAPLLALLTTLRI